MQRYVLIHQVFSILDMHTTCNKHKMATITIIKLMLKSGASHGRTLILRNYFMREG